MFKNNLAVIFLVIFSISNISTMLSTSKGPNSSDDSSGSDFPYSLEYLHNCEKQEHERTLQKYAKKDQTPCTAGSYITGVVGFSVGIVIATSLVNNLGFSPIHAKRTNEPFQPSSQLDSEIFLGNVATSQDLCNASCFRTYVPEICRNSKYNPKIDQRNLSRLSPAQQKRLKRLGRQ